MRRFVLIAVLALGSGLAGCRHNASPRPQPVRAVPADLPAEARLVAETDGAGTPLLFVAPGPGQVRFIANGKTLATFPVEAGDKVQLNSFNYTRPMTELRRNDEVVYASPNMRAFDNRIYFVADGM